MEHQKTHKRTDKGGCENKCPRCGGKLKLTLLSKLSNNFPKTWKCGCGLYATENAPHHSQQSIEDEEIAEYKEKLEKLCHVSGSGHCPGCGLSPIALESILATKTTVCDQRVREAVEAALWSVYDDGHISPRYIEEKLQALTKTD